MSTDMNTDTSIEFKYIKPKITVHVTSGYDKYDNECEIKNYPYEIKAKLDDLLGALKNGVKLCEEISGNKKLKEISNGYEGNLKDNLIKAWGCMLPLVWDIGWDNDEDNENE